MGGPCSRIGIACFPRASNDRHAPISLKKVERGRLRCAGRQGQPTSAQMWFARCEAVSRLFRLIWPRVLLPYAPGDGARRWQFDQLGELAQVLSDRGEQELVGRA